jgi:hypothetical protein
MPVSPLRCGVTQNYVEIAQCREWLKTGSIPVRAAKFSSEPSYECWSLLGRPLTVAYSTLSRPSQLKLLQRWFALTEKGEERPRHDGGNQCHDHQHRENALRENTEVVTDVKSDEFH